MTDFKINDLVRVVRQSKTINSHIHSVGLSGYIEDIIDEYAQFVELREDGLGSQGGVPMDCLELANDDMRLQNLKKAKDESFENIYKESVERTKRYLKERGAMIDHAMDETSTSKESIERIIKIFEDFEINWR